MNQNAMPGLDLSGLPPEVRAKIEKRFAAMSPEVRAKWAAGSGGVSRLVNLFNGQASTAGSGNAPPPLPASSQAGSAPRPPRARYQPSEPINPDRMDPHGHYNETVRPGDAPGSSAWILVVGLVLGIAALLLF